MVDYDSSESRNHKEELNLRNIKEGLDDWTTWGSK